MDVTAGEGIRETERQFEQVIRDVKLLTCQLSEKVDELRGLISTYERGGDVRDGERS